MSDKKSGVFYYGSSMLRTFVPGETLVLEDKPFEALVPGDVIAVFSNSDDSPGVIHRVISADGTCAVTMGDNNAAPDEDKVIPDSRFMLCTGAVSRNGKLRRIANGRAGMVKFRINRLRRFCRNAAAPLARKLFPLMFWRITLKESGRFADGSRCFSFGNSFIARRTASGIVRYRSEFCKLLFKLPEPERAAK
jgi:hypothetical protein